MEVPQVRSEDNWCAVLYKWVSLSPKLAKTMESGY